jgi:hypothetical protein
MKDTETIINLESKIKAKQHNQEENDSVITLNNNNDELNQLKNETMKNVEII